MDDFADASGVQQVERIAINAHALSFFGLPLPVARQVCETHHRFFPS
ncbi:hypothetical protein [Sphingomonas sp. Ant20]|nr:hypothetical protein [Sphingomonas sp. Ant20]